MAQLIHDPQLWSHKDDTIYMANAYVRGLQAAKNDPRAKAIMNEVAKSLGLTDNFITTARRGLFSPEVFARAPVYSEKELAMLDKANIAWSNLGLKIEMAIGHFNALHGRELVRDFTALTDKVILLANALEKLSEKLHLFEGINKLVGYTADVIGKTADVVSHPNLKTSENLAESVSPLYNLYELISKLVQSKTGSTTVNQTLNFSHAGTDPNKNAESHREAVKRAYRQMPAQLQSN